MLKKATLVVKESCQGVRGKFLATAVKPASSARSAIICVGFFHHAHDIVLGKAIGYSLATLLTLLSARSGVHLVTR